MYLSGEILFPLQNGSDIRGIAMEGDGEVNLTPQVARALGAAFGRWVSQKTGRTCDKLSIGVGCDSRITGGILKDAFLNGVVSDGIMAYDCGLASTPAMFMSTVFSESNFDASCMVTASHMPKNRNGFKFFTKKGGLEKSDIKLILTNAIGQEPKPVMIGYSVFDIMSYYCNHLKKIITKAVANGEKPLKGLHIVTDSGNGAGGFFEKRVLKPLGADVSGSIFGEPDGSFPNHIPNPENKEAMESIINVTLQNKADLGIIFDTDVDRAAAVLPDGTPISKDNLIAMLAALIRDDYPSCTIVTDSVTSDRLTKFLKNELSITHHRFKRGYRNVINEAVSLSKKGVVAPLAIETSGHGAFSENYYLDDGAYIAVKLVIAAAKSKAEGRTLAQYIEKMEQPIKTAELRLKINCEDFASYGDAVLKEFKDRAIKFGLDVVAPSYEGVRISFSEGWMLLRKSLHEPLLPLNVEGTKEGACEKILLVAEKLLDGFDKIDMTLFKK